MRPVNFMNALGGILNYRGEGGPANIILEVGPHPVLAPSIKECMAHFISSDSTVKIPLCHSIKRKEPERVQMLRTLSFLYLAEVSIDLFIYINP
jgi:acyl transferase domain-containing protein